MSGETLWDLGNNGIKIAVSLYKAILTQIFKN